jgi:hypothetical protein
MMKKLVFLVTGFAIALLCSNVCAAQNGPGPIPATLDATETADLLFMREEEKLSHDTNAALYDLWSYPVFSNISAAEQHHMDTLLSKLIFYGIEDPVPSNEAGDFSDTELSDLYLELIDRGETSLLEAFQVGAYIEEMSINELSRSISNTDEPPLLNAYSNLLAASRNHLRTFVSHIINQGVAYEAQILDQETVDEIVGDYDLLPAGNFSINSGLNDAWFYPATSGQGFFITVYPVAKTLFLGWFTYDTQLPEEGVLANLGDPGHRWLTAQGSYDGGQAILEIDFTSGGIFDNELPAPSHSPGGSILLQFDDCMNGSVTYDIPSAGLTGIIPIVRIASDNVTRCQELTVIE